MSAAAASKLHAITLIRSPIRTPKNIKATIAALGLKRIHQTVIHKNTPVGSLLDFVLCFVSTSCSERDASDSN